jgi:hypothetical protein
VCVYIYIYKEVRMCTKSLTAVDTGVWRVDCAQPCYYPSYILLRRLLLLRAFISDFENWIEAWGMLVELGVQFYSLYVWYFSKISVCLPLHILTFFMYTFSQKVLPLSDNSFYNHFQTAVRS